MVGHKLSEVEEEEEKNPRCDHFFPFINRLGLWPPSAAMSPAAVWSVGVGGATVWGAHDKYQLLG